MTAPCVHSRNWYKEMTRCLFCGAEYSDEEERRIHFERTRTFSAEQTAILEHLQAQPDHEHDFFCVHDEQQCDDECRLAHECRICHITVEQLRRKPCCKHPESDHVLTAYWRYCTRCPCSTHECTCKTRAEGGLDMDCPMHGVLHLTASELPPVDVTADEAAKANAAKLLTEGEKSLFAKLLCRERQLLAEIAAHVVTKHELKQAQDWMVENS